MRSAPILRALTTGVALALVAMVTPAASAATHKDPRGDVQWRVEGGAPAPTARDKAGADLTRFTYELKARKAVFTFKYRDLRKCLDTGICDDQENRAELSNKSGSKSVMISAVRYGRNPNVSSSVVWHNDGKGTYGVVCEAGQVSRKVSYRKDKVTVTVPQKCFKKGWRFKEVAGTAIRGWSDGTAWRDAFDFTDYYKVDWTARR